MDQLGRLNTLLKSGMYENQARSQKLHRKVTNRIVARETSLQLCGFNPKKDKLLDPYNRYAHLEECSVDND